MGYSDFVVFPFYLLLFAFIFSRLRRNYKDPLLKKYHKQGFWIKVLGCVAFTIFNAYISPAYVMPQNLVTTSGRPDLSERGENLFYISAGVGIRL